MELVRPKGTLTAYRGKDVSRRHKERKGQEIKYDVGPRGGSGGDAELTEGVSDGLPGPFDQSI